MAPDGWSKSKLGNLVKLSSGDSKPLDTVKEKGPATSIPVYGGNGVLGYSSSHNKAGTTVIIGRVGEYCGVTRLVEGKKWITDNALFIKELGNGIDIQFLTYRLQYFNLGKLRKKGGQPLISQKPIYNIYIDLPPQREQKRIAEILSTWDRAIETIEKLIANSQAQKKALMQQLLTGKKRLPGFDGEWKSKKLGELGVISSAGVDKKTVEGEPPVRLLNFLDAYNREFIWSSDLTQEVTAPPNKVSQCDVRRGDVFFTPSSETRDDIGLAAVAAESMPSVVYSYHVVRLRPKLPLDLNFSAYVFQTDHFRRQTYRAGDGSGQRYVISQNLFRAMDVMLPPLEEQRAVGEVLLSCSNQIAELQADLEALKVEKAALMQQLLTGKRRVTIEEAANA